MNTILYVHTVHCRYVHIQYIFIFQSSQEKFTGLAGCGILTMRLMFETQTLICQSKANLDVKILFGNITHLINPEIRKLLKRYLYGNQDSTLHSGP